MIILLTGPNNDWLRKTAHAIVELHSKPFAKPMVMLFYPEMSITASFDAETFSQSDQFDQGMKLIARVQSGDRFVVVTHSEHVFNAIRIGIKEEMIDHTKVEFRFCEPEKSDIIINPDSDGRFAQQPKGFFDQSVEELVRLL